MTTAVKESLNEKIVELKRFCINNKIPITICYADVTEKTVKYHPTIVTPIDCGTEMPKNADDRITPSLLMFNNGFSITPRNAKKDDGIIDMKELLGE